MIKKIRLLFVSVFFINISSFGFYIVDMANSGIDLPFYGNSLIEKQIIPILGFNVGIEINDKYAIALQANFNWYQFYKTNGCRDLIEAYGYFPFENYYTVSAKNISVHDVMINFKYIFRETMKFRPYFSLGIGAFSSNIKEFKINYTDSVEKQDYLKSVSGFSLFSGLGFLILPKKRNGFFSKFGYRANLCNFFTFHSLPIKLGFILRIKKKNDPRP